MLLNDSLSVLEDIEILEVMGSTEKRVEMIMKHLQEKGLSFN